MAFIVDGLQRTLRRLRRLARVNREPEPSMGYSRSDSGLHVCSVDDVSAISYFCGHHHHSYSDRARQRGGVALDGETMNEAALSPSIFQAAGVSQRA